MRVAAIADLHGLLPDVPACDLLLLGGDLTPTSDHAPDFQARWLDGPFRAWLESAPARHVVGIAGNHDFVFQQAPELVPADLPWTYLEDGGTTVEDVGVWGSPWTPWFYDWAFNAPRADGEEFLAERYAQVPEGTDVLLLHGPPAGYGGATASGVEAGAQAAVELIDRVRPRLAVYGHIHEGRGAWERGATAFHNVAAVDVQYAPYPDPFLVLDL